MKVVIDRFEGKYAVVELPDRTMVNMPKVLVPDAREGDIILISIDASETSKRKENIKKLVDEVWKN